MANHFKTALEDPMVTRRYEGKPFYMATLSALSAFTEEGKDFLKLPWFSMTKTAKGKNKVLKAA